MSHIAKRSAPPKSNEDLTVDEWLAELEALTSRSGGDDGLSMTTEEMAAKFGRSGYWVLHNILHPARRCGRLKVTMVVRENLAGKMQMRPAYRVLRSAEKKGRSSK